MPHELKNWVAPKTVDPPYIYASYVKTQVETDGWWDEAVITFTGVQRHYHDGQFSGDHVDGTREFAVKIIEVVQRHQDEILRACGFEVIG